MINKFATGQCGPDNPLIKSLKDDKLLSNNVGAIDIFPLQHIARLPNDELTFKKLRETNVRRCETSIRKLDSWEPIVWAACCAGECGELLNWLKKVKRGDKVDINEIAAELADVLTYLDLTAAALGIDLEQAVIKKFNEVSDRWKSDIKL